MRRIIRLGSTHRDLTMESLERRVLLDSQLGDAFSQFDSEAELQAFLIDQAVERYEHQFGEPGYVWDWFPPGCPNCYVLVDAVADGAAPNAGSNRNESSLDYSDTNTQVENVDEGDIIETDGDYVYLLSNNELTIVDVRTPEHPRVASRVDLDDSAYANEMFLDGDRLVVLATGWDHSFTEPWIGGAPPPFDVAIDVIYPYGGQQYTVATVVDVSDREAPATVSNTEFDGSLTSSRAIDGTAYLLLQDYLNLPVPELHPIEDSPTNPKRGEPTHVYETEAEYRDRVASFILDVLPEHTSFDSDGNEVSTGYLTEPTSIYRPADSQTSGMMSIVSIDMHLDEPASHEVTSLMAATGHEIYMSRDSLYVFQPVWGQDEQTSIVKFDLGSSDGPAEPVASGSVPGRMLNQFSADEFFPNLRIATTSGWGREATNGVYVLEQDGSDLNITGSIENMAPGENIFSVRFMGYLGYVVTFERVDPLFALNLSDPANPVIEGELKISGFSEYLHPVGDNHLLGIGRNADEETGRVGDLQVSLFDISDVTDPQLADRHSFEGAWDMWSLAESDHHAFAYYPDFQTIAFPITIYDRSESGWVREDGEQLWVPPEVEHALHVFQIDVDAGEIDLVGKVEHPSEVRRSVRIGESLISASYDTLKVSAIGDPDTVIGQVHFLPPQTPGVPIDPPDAEDIDILFEAAASGANRADFDLDGNSLVNTDDIEFAVHAMLRTEYGDADLDGDVDFADFVTLANNFEQEGGWADGDFDGDGLVGFEDFTLLTNNFGS